MAEQKASTPKKSIRIVRFTSENFKRLKAIDITPKKGQSVIEISGKNDAGKSSILDGIWAVLEWAEAKKVIQKPIRKGAASATNTIDLGDITVTRTWTAGGSYLTVANKEGAVYKSPQAILDALKGKLSFDPLEFANMESEEQMDLFFKITGLGEKIAEIDKQKANAYTERTIINREIRDLTGRQRISEQSGALAVVNDPTVPDEELQVKELMEEIAIAQKKIDANNVQRRDVQDKKTKLADFSKAMNETEAEMKTLEEKFREQEAQYRHNQGKAVELAANVKKLKDRDIEAMLEQVKQLMAQIEIARKTVEDNNTLRRDLETRKADLIERSKQNDETLAELKRTRDKNTKEHAEYRSKQAELMDLTVTVNPLKDPDIASMMAKANNVDETNKKVRAKKQYQSVADMISEKEKKVAELEDGMAKADLQKTDLFKTTPMPIAGITVGPDGILLYNENPLKQCSTSERIRVSTAIAMAMNPTLRVIRIADGSLLDKTNMAEITKMAKDNNYQIWIEQVDETGKVGIYIEDGEVKNDLHSK